MLTYNTVVAYGGLPGEARVGHTITSTSVAQ